MNQKAEFCKIFKDFAYRYNCHDVFFDFCEVSALSLRQVFERKQENEEQYLKIINKYEPDEQNKFAELLALTADALSENPRDFLGECFHELEMHNKFQGQFFTPFDVSRLMAKISLEGFKEKIKKQGFITIHEPTCGAGGMIIALYNEIREASFNPTNVMFVVAQDIDRKCCNMTYIQLSLLAIPAVVIWGNTLTLEFRSQWYTSGYFLGAWPARLRWREAINAVQDLEESNVSDLDDPATQIPTPVPAPLCSTSGQLMFDF